MNEAETRAEHIDPALRAAGWGVRQPEAARRTSSQAARPVAKIPRWPGEGDLLGFARRGISKHTYVRRH